MEFSIQSRVFSFLYLDLQLTWTLNNKQQAQEGSKE